MYKRLWTLSSEIDHNLNVKLVSFAPFLALIWNVISDLRLPVSLENGDEGPKCKQRSEL